MTPINRYVKHTDEMGRGLYALYDLEPEKVLFSAELLVLNETDTKKLQETDLKFYTFKYNETQDCLVLGDGELFNHDDNANIGYKLIDENGRRLMLFYTKREIKQHDQLFIDYNADEKVNTKEYVNKNLTGG